MKESMYGIEDITGRRTFTLLYRCIVFVMFATLSVSNCRLLFIGGPIIYISIITLHALYTLCCLMLCAVCRMLLFRVAFITLPLRLAE